jgi:hypothetical protein
MKLNHNICPKPKIMLYLKCEKFENIPCAGRHPILLRGDQGNLLEAKCNVVTNRQKRLGDFILRDLLLMKSLSRFFYFAWSVTK